VELGASPELKSQAISELIKYLHTDTIWYTRFSLICRSSISSFFDANEKLLSRQQQLWAPIHNALEHKFALKIAKAYGTLTGSDQSAEVVDKFAKDLNSSSSFCISGIF
jgi:chaperone required for assembly of F1-ATPase